MCRAIFSILLSSILLFAPQVVLAQDSYIWTPVVVRNVLIGNAASGNDQV